MWVLSIKPNMYIEIYIYNMIELKMMVDGLS
jgi:hypothetical protein